MHTTEAVLKIFDDVINNNDHLGAIMTLLSNGNA